MLSPWRQLRRIQKRCRRQCVEIMWYQPLPPRLAKLAALNTRKNTEAMNCFSVVKPKFNGKITTPQNEAVNWREGSSRRNVLEQLEQKNNTKQIIGAPRQTYTNGFLTVTLHSHKSPTKFWFRWLHSPPQPSAPITLLRPSSYWCFICNITFKQEPTYKEALKCMAA